MFGSLGLSNPPAVIQHHRPSFLPEESGAQVDLGRQGPARGRTYLQLEHAQLGFARIERLKVTKLGDYGRVHDLRMLLDQGALTSFLGNSLAGGPVTDLVVRPAGTHLLGLEARAFGLPLRAKLGLGASSGRVLMTIKSARAGWFTLPAKLLRDQLLASSEPEVVRLGWVAAAGSTGVSFDPDYLFSHVAAGLPGALAQAGLPRHLKVHLRQVELDHGWVLVEGGD